MNLSPRFQLLLCLFLLGSGSLLRAHQIPALGLEVEINEGEPHVLRLNIDPRLILSNAPATLPPVDVSWYRDQTPEQLSETHAKAAAYVIRTVKFLYGPGTASPIEWNVQPMDGASNQPLSGTSTEVHLLAEARYSPPPSSTSLTVGLAGDSAAALTILTVVDGKPGRRPQVLFPGETGKPIPWTKKEAPPQLVSTPVPSSPESAPSFVWHLAPAALGFRHALMGGAWHHLWFVLILVLALRPVKTALLALVGFHAVHLTTTIVCSWNQTVLNQPGWIWPALATTLLAAPLIRNRMQQIMFVGLIVASLAALHSLNQWPHAAEPRIVVVMELAFAGGHLICLLPLLALRAVWGQKKAAMLPPSS